ncbi:MAG: hypothetical protein KA154_14725 [Gemmatimonadaceae bacterium]|nr:hypothetical protein [Gemmatimonadaceae bacterium]
MSDDANAPRVPSGYREPTLAPMTYREADLADVRTIPIQVRPNKVRAEEFAVPPGDDARDRTMGDFLSSLPDILVARDFLAVVNAIVEARRRERGVLLMLGGHVVKTGLARVLVDLVRRGVVTHVAMNGSAAIHDYEVARFGGTSEDVAAGLRDGSFGMAEETGRGLNGAFVAGMQNQWGMGESVARNLAQHEPLAHGDLSLTYQCWRLGVPATIHAALGAEIIHQHPAANGAAIGDTSHRDFRRLAASIATLHDGGVVLNVGSAVIMPEVFLKALTIARNLNAGRPTNFVTCDLDMQRHYRPRMNVVRRPTQDSGKGYEITGHHEIMVPLLAWAIVERMATGR